MNESGMYDSMEKLLSFSKNGFLPIFFGPAVYFIEYGFLFLCSQQFLFDLISFEALTSHFGRNLVQICLHLSIIDFPKCVRMHWNA